MKRLPIAFRPTSFPPALSRVDLTRNRFLTWLFIVSIFFSVFAVPLVGFAYDSEPEWAVAQVINNATDPFPDPFDGISTHRNITHRAIELVGTLPGYAALKAELEQTFLESVSSNAAEYGTDYEDFNMISSADRQIFAFLSSPFSMERNLNHGFNPLTQKGWPTPTFNIFLEKQCWNQPFSVMNAKEWANSPRNLYNWNNAIVAHRNGDKKQAYTWLGHIAHLLADVSVPAHVHIVDHGKGVGIFDPCVNGHEDNYEKYSQTHHQEFLPIANTENIPTFSSLADAFRKLALITWPVGSKGNLAGWVERYADDEVDGNTDGFGSYLDLNGNRTDDEPCLERQPIPCFDDSTEASVMRSYAMYLLPKAAEHVAGLFKFFWDETHSDVATIPFQWPVNVATRNLSQDYAHYNNGVTDKWHTGLDIPAPQGTNVFAAAAGTVVVRCLPPNHPGSPNQDCPANDTAGTIDNHGLQGVVILEHTLTDGRLFYSMYAHLGNIDSTPARGQSVSAGQLLGTTNSLNHVHFEIKARAVLHNPHCPGYINCLGGNITPSTCTLPAPSCDWGYSHDPNNPTRGNPDDFGYYDPVLFLHSVLDLVQIPVQVILNNANIRMGPEATTAGYPVLAQVNAGQQFTAIRKRNEATTGCSNGWYQILRPDGSRFVVTSFDSDPDDEVPDVWICADFISQNLTLSVSLAATPSSGIAPLSTNLTADVSGTATGTINYTFWWNCTDPGTSVSAVTAVCGDPTNSTIGAKFSGVTDDPKIVNHVYLVAGTYTAKVVVERGTAPPAEARVTVTVTSAVTIIFQDNMESGPGGWFAQSPWAQTTTTSHSATHSWTDSPAGNYSNNANVSLWSPFLNFSGFNSITITFWHRYDLENSFDFGNVWVTTDNGVTFTQATAFTGTNTTWTQATVNLDGFAGQPSVRVLFQLFSDSSVTRDGWYIDDVVVTGSNAPFVFVSSFADGKIYKVNSETGNNTLVASGLGSPEDMAMDSIGILYIGGLFTGIKRFDTKTNTFLTVVGTNVCGPEGPVIDANGDLFVNTRSSPCSHSGVWKIAGRTATTAVQVVPPFSTFGEGTAFLQSGPFAGHLIASDRSGGRLVRSAPPNFGTAVNFITGLDNPMGIAVHPSTGDVFLTELNNGRILQFDSGGSFKSVFTSGLNRPVFLEFDSLGNLFVAESGSGNLLKFTPGGTKTILASGFGEIVGVAFALSPISLPSLLTVSPVPSNGFVTASGISCGAGGTGDCNESYNSGTNVTLTGNPASGFQIGIWTGCTPINNNTQCTALMTQARTVTVTFTPITVLLTILPVPANGFISGSGISCGTGGTGDCSEPYNSGATATLTANPVTGFQVGTWTGCTPISNNTQCTVSMTQARTVSVTFDPIPVGSLQFSSSAFSVNENGGPAVITVTRTGGSNGAVGVTFTTSNGTAQSGSDYAAVINQIVSFANGDTVSKTVNVPITNDSSFEGNETVNLTLSNPTGGATLGSPSTAVLTIVDDDPAPPGSLQFSSSTYSVNENGGPAVITVTRTGGSNGAVGVTFTTSNGTAQAGSDYTAVNQTVSFANGDTASKTVNMPITNDSSFEGNETVNLTLSTHTGGATLGSPSTAVLTIVDDDPAFDYTLSNSGNITVTQGSSGLNTITTNLVSGTSQAVSLSVTSGLPSGATASFTTNPCNPTCSSTLTISTSASTPADTYTITVTGSPLSKTTTFTLVVNAAIKPGVVVRAAHFNELCDSINNVRNNNGFSKIACPTLTAGVTVIAAKHLTDLQTEIRALYILFGKEPPALSPIVPRETVIQSKHIAEMQSAIKAAEGSSQTLTLALTKTASGTGTASTKAGTADTGTFKDNDSVGLTDLLADALEYTGSYPTPDIVTFPEDGSITSVLAYPGQVLLFFTTSTGRTDATALIQAHRATVLTQYPSLGYYLVGVTPGSEGAFISAMVVDPRVSLAVPHLTGQGKSTTIIGVNCSDSHTEAVEAELELFGGTSAPVCLSATDGFGRSPKEKVINGVIHAVAETAGTETFINLSIGPNPNADFTLFDINGDTLIDGEDQAIFQANWRNDIRIMLVAIARLPEAYRENLVVTVAAGNENLPLAPELARIRGDPMIARILRDNVVIATTERTTAPSGSATQPYPTGDFANFAPGDPDVVIINNEAASLGTSLAAPAILGSVEKVLADLKTVTGAGTALALKGIKLAMVTNRKHELVLNEAIDKVGAIREAEANDPSGAAEVTAISFISVGELTEALITPAIAGVTVEYTVSGTAGVFDRGTLVTDTSGRVSFFITPGEPGVTDRISVSAVLSGRWHSYSHGNQLRR